MWDNCNPITSLRDRSKNGYTVHDVWEHLLFLATRGSPGFRPPMAMAVDRARFNMVEQQIRPWDVLDQQVLDLLWKVKREDFVPPQYRSLAFVDMEVPLSHGQTLLQPKME